MFSALDAQSPWSRSAAFGFRCARYPAPPPPDQLAPMLRGGVVRDRSAVLPLSEEAFGIYRGLYSYEKSELRARVDSLEQGEHWRLEKVSYAAAYDEDRVPAYLFLPRNARPPYQTVVYFPSGEGSILRSNDDIRVAQLEFLVRSGRAVLHPIYWGMYARNAGQRQRTQYRDAIAHLSRDIGRSVDYLETRADIDARRLAYYQRSAGGMGAVLLALEDRFRAAVLHGAGLPAWEQRPETDPARFAPRVKTPVLMLSGRYDFSFPVESAQKPLFHLLGAPDKDKRHALFDAGHGGLPERESIREVLDWLDRHLGPVAR